MSARNTWLALGSSVALNLLFLGTFLGGYLRPSPPPDFLPPPHEREGDGHRPPHPHAPPLMRILQSLPEAAQAKVRPLLEKYEPELKAKGDALHEIRHDIQKILLADPLDVLKLNETLAHAQRAFGDFQSSLQRALGEIAMQLNAEERKVLAESLSKRP